MTNYLERTNCIWKYNTIKATHQISEEKEEFLGKWGGDNWRATWEKKRLIYSSYYTPR